MTKKILVTGGTGYIGSHTTVELQNAGYEVISIDNLSNSEIGVLDGIEKITGRRPAFEAVDLPYFVTASSRAEAQKSVSMVFESRQDSTLRLYQSMMASVGLFHINKPPIGTTKVKRDRIILLYMLIGKDAFLLPLRGG